MKLINIFFIFLLVAVSSCSPKPNFTKEIILKALIDEKDTVDLGKAVPVITHRLIASGPGDGFHFQIDVIDKETISVKTSSFADSQLEDLKTLLTKRGRLAFHEVHQDNQKIVNQLSKNPKTEIAVGYKLMTKVELDGTLSRFIVKKRVAMAGKIAKAYVVAGPYGGYEIMINFTPKGTRQFAAVTKRCVGKQLAIIVDNRLYSAPMVAEAITQGNARVTGDFTLCEA